MRILITGSRDWSDRERVQDEIDRYLNEKISRNFFPEIVIVHGDCPTGADHWASLYADSEDFINEKHPADWERYGKRAGFLRNAEMVEKNADVCLAFIQQCGKTNCVAPKPHGSHGATMTLRMARNSGMPTRVFGINE